MTLPRQRAGRVAVLAVTISAIVVVFVAIMVGAVPLPPRVVFAALMSAESPHAEIVRSLRVPRVLLAFVVGGSLAVCGAALQAVVRNPLAEPWLLGVSGGASLGAVIATIVGLPPGWSVAACASAGALLAAAVVYRISTIRGRRLDSNVLVLAGVVIAAFAGALTTIMLAVVDPFTFRAATMWMFGGFAGASWQALRDFAVIAVVPLGIIAWLARPLDLIALGDDAATSLGADVDRVRRIAVVVTSVLTAATVSAAGVIGFVGLIVPHAMRWMVGPLHRRLLPVAFVAGGGFTVLADTVARSVTSSELPVGTITALIGVPTFAVLLRRSIR